MVVSGCNVGGQTDPLVSSQVEVLTSAWSGVARLEAAACSTELIGATRATATGFLVGERLLLTSGEFAREASERGCAVIAKMGGRNYQATAATLWRSPGADGPEGAVASLQLSDAPPDAHVTEVARQLPPRNAPVAVIGIARGLGPSIQQGLSIRATASGSRRVVTAMVVADEGSEGAPLLNAAGRAIGVVTSTVAVSEDPLNASNYVAAVGLTAGGTIVRALCREHPEAGGLKCGEGTAEPGATAATPLKLRRAAVAPVSTAPPIPATLFRRLASGVVFIEFSKCAGGADVPGFARNGSTGFLVGSRVVLTARHVVTSATALRCKMSVNAGGKVFGVTGAAAWRDGAAAPERVDLASLELDGDAPGVPLAAATALPEGGEAIATFGHPLGLPLNFQQGRLEKHLELGGVPAVLALLPFEPGNSGGPLVNQDGEVFGIITNYSVGEAMTTSPLAGALDLVRWFGGNWEDLCARYPDGGIPSCGSGDATGRTSLPMRLDRQQPS